VATFISNSPAETEAFGRRFAKGVSPGSVLALKGELGSGKTQFVKGLVAGLGSEAPVTSPTFTIVHEYAGGRLPVYHFDFFRLQDRQRSRREPSDVDLDPQGLASREASYQSVVRLGLDDYFFGAGLSVIEWADKFPELIPEQAQWIFFEMKSEKERMIATRDDAIRESRIALKPHQMK